MRTKVYDKAIWHIDGGEDKKEVLNRFKNIFEFLSENNLLSKDGIDVLKYAMDSSVSLNAKMVTTEGKIFLDKYYDNVIKQNEKEVRKNLINAYKDFSKKIK